MKNFMLVIFLFSMLSGLFARTDTVYIVKIDTVFVSESQDLIYKRFIEDKRVETSHMWKLNLLDLGFYKPNLGYEHKIGRMWSAEGYASYGYSKGSVIRGGNYTGYSNILANADVELQLKYYYNLNLRQRKGKRVYGFSGDYFAATIWYSYYDYNSFIHNNISIENHTNYYSVGLKYGIQRRIGNLVYFDGFIGVLYTWQEDKYDPYHPAYGSPTNTIWHQFPMWVLGIRVGFGIDSFKNLRKHPNK